MYFVYIIKCSDGTLYTGITTDLARRFEEHKNGKGARYTRSRKVSSIAYAEMRRGRSAALKREAEIKAWRKEKKLDLIKKNPYRLIHHKSTSNL